MTPSTPRVPLSGGYQLSPEASKGNAFCWLTWRPCIEWVPKPPQGRPRDDYSESARKQTEHIERRRAAGHDPLYVPGLGKQRTFNIKQFAITLPKVNP